jgi:pilus assembly protein FimV
MLLLLGGVAQAAGLGKLTVSSHLSEPLRAEIDVVAVEKGELETLNAKLASPDAYIQSNLPYPPASLGLRLSVEQRPSGAPYISVSSTQPISEPFVDLLIELNWQGGKILRAYTALLDPPSFAPPPTAGAPAQEAPTTAALPPPPPAPSVETIMGSEMQKPAAPAAPAEAAPPPVAAAEGTAPTAPAAQPSAPPAEAPAAEAGMPAKPEVAPKSETAVKPEAAQFKEDSYGPVKRGDTLSKIAKEFKPSDVTLEQMLVLLYRNNKSAFVANNMNRLKTGKVLTVPDLAEASGISVKEARREVRLQAADFNAYRERLAATAGESSPAQAEGGKAAAGRLTGPVEDLGKTGAGEPKEVLKLSKGEAPGAGGGKAAQAKIHSLEEEVAARDKTIKEANERITKLEKTIKDMQGLIDLKTKGMAELQNPPGATPPGPGKPGAPAPRKPELPPSPPPVAAPPPPVATPAAPAKPAPVPPMASTTTPGVTAPPPPLAPGVPPKPAPSVPGATPGMTAPMAASGTQPAMPGTEAKPKPKPKPKIVTAPPPPAPSSLIDQVLDEPLYLAGGAAVLVVLAFLGYRFFRSRGESGRDDLAAEKKTSEVSAFADTGTDNSGAMAAAARAAPAQVTEEVDPLAEAEIYLAYGRDGQAEEILKEALAAQPRRAEIHLKLLEIYAKRKDAQSFEPIFRELQTSTGSQGELWLQAARLGYQLDPANPRYQAGKPSGAEAAAAEAASTDKTLDFQVDAFEPAPEIGTLTDIDAGFGRRFATATATGASTGGEHLDLNISLDDTSQAPGTKTDIDLGRLGVSGDSTAVDVDLDSLGGPTRGATNTDIDLGTLSAEESTQMPAMDFNLELPPADEKTESQLAKVDSLNFDVKFDDIASASKDAGGGLDFDIDKISLESGTAGKPEPVLDLERSVPPMPEIDLSSISLDLGDAPAGSATGGGGAKDERWYDVQTKFDLAKAYQEMGDKEGAREILQEVIAEGDAEQKAEAQKVLEALA